MLIPAPDIVGTDIDVDIRIQGFAAAHELVMDTADGRRGEESEEAALSTAIVDHNPAACRLCLAHKSGGSGNGNTEGSGGGGGGLLFPLSPPLWARIGAADSSTHGVAAGGKGKDGGAAKGNKDKDGAHSSPFFPAKSHSQPQSQSPGTERTSTSNHSSSTASAKSGGSGSIGGEDGGGGGGEESSHSVGAAGAAPAPAPAAAAAAAAVGSNLFRGGGAMFSGMKMNMNMGGIFGKGGGAGAGANGPGEGVAGAGSDADAAASGSADAGADAGSADAAAAASAAQPTKADGAAELAAKLRTSVSSSFGRFGSSKEARLKKGAEGSAGGAVAAATGSAEKEQDSGFGSLFRKVG